MARNLVWGPTDEKRSAGLVGEDLEYTRHAARLGNTHEETTVENVELVLGQACGATPIRQGGLVVRVIVARREIDDDVEETEIETFGGPVDDDVDDHVVGVDGNFLRIGPGMFYTLEGDRSWNGDRCIHWRFDQYDVV